MAPSLRVLVADDNVDFADSLALLLRIWGYEVRLAHDGPIALAEALAWRPDVTILDIGLPRLSGLEVARGIRREVGPGGMFLVAMTGFAHRECRRQSREAGFNRFMVKPADPEHLRHLLAGARGGSSPCGGGTPADDWEEEPGTEEDPDAECALQTVAADADRHGPW